MTESILKISVQEGASPLPTDEPKGEGKKGRWITLMALIRLTLSIQDQTIAFTNLTQQAAKDQAGYNKDQNTILQQDLSKLTEDSKIGDKDARSAAMAVDQAQFNLDQTQTQSGNDRLSVVTQNTQNEVKSMGTAQSQDDQNAQGVLSALQFLASLLRAG